MGILIVAEDTSYIVADGIASLILIGASFLVFVLVRRIRRDRQVDVKEDIRVTASSEEVAARIVAALGAFPKAEVTHPGPWQYVIVVKHIPALAAVLGGVILVLFARTTLTLQVTLYQEADSTIVVRLSGATELSVLESLRLQIDPGQEVRVA